MENSNFVAINEEGPREGFQIESASIPTSDKIALIDALSLTGLTRDTDRILRQSEAGSEHGGCGRGRRRLTPRDGVNFTGLYLNEQGLRRAIATGRLHIEGGISLCAPRPFCSVTKTPRRSSSDRAEGR